MTYFAVFTAPKKMPSATRFETPVMFAKILLPTAKIFLLLRLKDVLSIVCLRSLESWNEVGSWCYESLSIALCTVGTTKIFFHLILKYVMDTKTSPILLQMFERALVTESNRN